MSTARNSIKLARMDLAEKLRPAHTALLVIDIQVDFCSPAGALAKTGRDYAMMDPMIDRLEQTIEKARQVGILTLYTRQVYDRQKLNPLQLEQYDLDGKPVTCDVATSGADFYRITPPPGDVYEKYNFNAFSNRDFVRRLEENGIKTLVIVGVDTQYCVETAVRNGFDLGYKIVVPSDLVAANAKHLDLHERTLYLVKRTYGVLTDAKTLVRLWDLSDQPAANDAVAVVHHG